MVHACDGPLHVEDVWMSLKLPVQSGDLAGLEFGATSWKKHHAGVGPISEQGS